MASETQQRLLTFVMRVAGGYHHSELSMACSLCCDVLHAMDTKGIAGDCLLLFLLSQLCYFLSWYLFARSRQLSAEHLRHLHRERERHCWLSGDLTISTRHATQLNTVARHDTCNKHLL